MNHASGRAVWLCVIALAVAFACYQQTLPGREDFGIAFSVPRHGPGSVLVTRVQPGSPAAQAGIRAGDMLAYGDTAFERARILYATPGSRVAIVVNGTRRVVMTARRTPYDPVTLILLAIRLAFLLVAAMLAWRRPGERACSALILFLVCFGLALAMSNCVLATPLLSLIVLQIGFGALFVTGMAAAAVFVATFPSGWAGAIPRAFAIAAQVLAGIMIAVFILGELLFARTADQVSLLNAGVFAGFVGLGLLVGGALVSAYVWGPREQRERRRWIFLIVGVGLAGPLADIAVTLTIGLQPLADELTLLPLTLIPVGLAYVILRHRVIDVGFVINRAVVYAGVSAFVVAVFVVVETLVNNYVDHVSRAGSIAVQLAVALALGFSIRFIHRRVEHVVDRVLFRERHDAEAAIRALAHDASYITDAGVLLARCVQTIERYTHAHAGVWIAEGSRYRAAATSFAAAPEIDENDAAAVAMRARRVSVHVRDCDSGFPGVLAFPMIVRGDLIGVLVCGHKASDETYAPDEADALASLAAAAGHALDALEVRDLRRRIAALEARLGGHGATGGALGTF